MFRPALAALCFSLPLASGHLIVPGQLPAELPAEPPLPSGAVPTALGVTGPHAVCAGDAPQYSGRLAAGGDAEYFFFLASARAPAPAPLIVWLTGGPGCASSIALLTENGPCEITGGGPGNWETTRNPHSWTEAANVMWVDQPAGVGFSTGSSSTTGTEDDVGEHMVAFLVNFYANFPDLQSAPLYIFGESYAGHFGTETARAVLRARDALPFVRLSGVGIGNGWVQPWPQLTSKPIMAFTGGPGGSLNGGVVDRKAFERMEAGLPNCSRAITECHSHQETCVHDLGDECWGPLMTDVSATGLNLYDLRKPCGSDPMCYDMTLPSDFLSDPAVQQTLGVSPSENWQMCNNSVWNTFAASGDWLSRIDGAVTELLAAGVSFLVYNGDCDYMCDWVGSKAWATELAWPHTSAFAELADVPYQVGGRAAGMERSIFGFTFLQIYEAGHMVPMDQPEVALAMVRELLHGDRWRAPEPGAEFSALATGPAVAAPLAASAAAGLALLLAGAGVVVLHRRGSRGRGVAEEGYAQLGA